MAKDNKDAAPAGGQPPVVPEHQPGMGTAQIVDGEPMDLEAAIHELIDLNGKLAQRVLDMETFVDRILDGGMSTITNYDLAQWRAKRGIK